MAAIIEKNLGRPPPPATTSPPQKSHSLQGLTDNEVIARRKAGQGNNIKIKSSRTYAEILRDNLLTFINFVFLGIGAVLLSLGYYSDMLIIIATVLSATLVNAVQEVRAKRQLDRIALLSRPKATAIRQGARQQIDPTEIVVGDILEVGPGDQILVDGVVVGDGELEVDESLLTGEADLIHKQSGQPVYSGSFCVTGKACYEAQKVGVDSMAHKITAEARSFRVTKTPLQKEINLVVRVLLLTAIFLWTMEIISWWLGDVDFLDTVQYLSVTAGLVPIGLYLSITLAYALGAVRMARQNALIQQANAVESLSHVDIICLDKTGTLTTNHLDLHEVHPLHIEANQLTKLLGQYAASTADGNRTNEAIAAAYPTQPRQVIDKVPFSSAYKWSALHFESVEGESVAPGQGGIYVLGAPEVLAAHAPLTPTDQTAIQKFNDAGLRVLLFAHSRCTSTPLRDTNRQPRLPAEMTPLGLITFTDQLRPSARETLAKFTAAGVSIKIISGDNPHTVAALARQVGLGPDIRVVAGSELADMSEGELAQTAEEALIFGRITPSQKARLVQALRNRGHYVAMMGDGVNDVLSLKQANLGIAMESGSQVTRSVADMVLLKDTFEVLPFTFVEGQRIRNAVLDQLKLFMVRIFSAVLLILATGLVTSTFPLLIKHNSIVVLLTVGIPTMALAFWAKPGQPSRQGLVRSALHFVVPASLLLAMVGLVVYLGYLMLTVLILYLNGVENVTSDAILAIPRSALVTIWVYCGILLLPFLKPPHRFWKGGEEATGDRRLSYLAVGMLALYIIVINVPWLRDFFGLIALGPTNYIFLGVVALGWAILLRYVWRAKLLDRFLDTDLSVVSAKVWHPESK